MVSKLGKIANSLNKARDYITLVAYGIVLADMLELAKEVITEFLMHKRFNSLVQRHVEEIEELKEDTTNFDTRNEKEPEKDTFFNEV